jgi:hypothetical protein
LTCDDCLTPGAKAEIVHALFSLARAELLHLAINERINPTASWFDTLAKALVAAGAFAPAAAAFYGVRE